MNRRQLMFIIFPYCCPPTTMHMLKAQQQKTTKTWKVFVYRDKIHVNWKVDADVVLDGGSVTFHVPVNSINHIVRSLEVDITSLMVRSQEISLTSKNASVVKGDLMEPISGMITVKTANGDIKSFPERSVGFIDHGKGHSLLSIDYKNSQKNPVASLDISFWVPIRGSWKIEHTLDLNENSTSKLMTSVAMQGGDIAALHTRHNNTSETIIDELVFIDKFIEEVRTGHYEARSMAKGRESFRGNDDESDISSKTVDGQWLIKNVRIRGNETLSNYMVREKLISVKPNVILDLCECTPRLVLTFDDLVEVEEGYLTVRLPNGQLHHGSQLLKPSMRRIDMGITTGLVFRWKKSGESTESGYTEYQVNATNLGTIPVNLQIWARSFQKAELVTRVKENEPNSGVKVEQQFTSIRDEVENVNVTIIPISLPIKTSLLRLRVYS